MYTRILETSMRLYTRILGSSMRESHSPRGVQGGPRCAAGAPQIRICEFLGGPAEPRGVQGGPRCAAGAPQIRICEFLRGPAKPRGVQGGPRCAAGAPQIRICEFLRGPAAGSVVQYASVQTHTGLQYAYVRTQYCVRTCAYWAPVCVRGRARARQGAPPWARQGARARDRPMQH